MKSYEPMHPSVKKAIRQLRWNIKQTDIELEAKIKALEVKLNQSSK